jgi:hypothetical protein
VYTNATANPDVSLAGDTTQAQWYTGPADQPVTLNISIVYSGNTVSFYMNGTIVTTKIGTSIPCITSSAPYYPGIRVLSQSSIEDVISMNLLPAQGPTGPFTPTNLTLVSRAPQSVLSLNNSNSISVVKPGTVNLNDIDMPFVTSGNALTGPFVLNFMFNTDAAASTAANDGSTPSTTAHAVEFAVGLVSTVEARTAFNGTPTRTMLYGMMVNGRRSLYKTDEPSGPIPDSPNTITLSPNLSIQMSTSATPQFTVPLGGNHSLQMKYDGTNLSYYVDGKLILPNGAPADQGFTFTPTTKGPYYLVMSFANGDQFSSIPAGQTVCPTNFTLQVTMSELFGANSLLGTTLTHLQTFTYMASPNVLPTTASLPTGTNLTAQRVRTVPFQKDTSNSSSAQAEITYNGGVFTYAANDGASKAMVNLIIYMYCAGASAFTIRTLTFDIAGNLKGTLISAPSVTSTGGTVNMKLSFLLNSGDSFLLQASGGTSSNVTLDSGSVVVEKLPVAQGGGGQRWVTVKPIPKRHPSRKSSLRISRVSTKKGDRK